jgi:hypothetical protein
VRSADLIGGFFRPSVAVALAPASKSNAQPATQPSAAAI